MKTFFMVAGVKRPGIGGGNLILSDFRELSFCGPFDVHTNNRKEAMVHKSSNSKDGYI